MSMADQKTEIEELNIDYRKALKDKTSMYEGLVTSVQELANKNSSYMENEIEICRLKNNIHIIQKQLEQREGKVGDLK